MYKLQEKCEIGKQTKKSKHLLRGESVGVLKEIQSYFNWASLHLSASVLHLKGLASVHT